MPPLPAHAIGLGVGRGVYTEVAEPEISSEPFATLCGIDEPLLCVFTGGTFDDCSDEQPTPAMRIARKADARERVTSNAPP